MKWNKKIVIILLLILISAGTYWLFNSVGKKSSYLSGGKETAFVLSEIKLEEKTEKFGEINVTISPEITGDEIAFSVTMDTHSVDLNYDLMMAAELTDENGKRYSPVVWEGEPPGGHHRKGVLKFGVLSPLTGKIFLKVKEVGGIKEKIFEWEL